MTETKAVTERRKDRLQADKWAHRLTDKKTKTQTDRRQIATNNAYLTSAASFWCRRQNVSTHFMYILFLGFKMLNN